MRFASPFSRAGESGSLDSCTPDVQRGEDFGGFLGKLENPGFQVLGKPSRRAPVLGLASIVSGVWVGETGSARPKIAVARVVFIRELKETCLLSPWGG